MDLKACEFEPDYFEYLYSIKDSDVIVNVFKNKYTGSELGLLNLSYIRVLLDNCLVKSQANDY